MTAECLVLSGLRWAPPAPPAAVTLVDPELSLECLILDVFGLLPKLAVAW